MSATEGLIFSKYISLRNIFLNLPAREDMTGIYHQGLLNDQTSIHIFHPPEIHAADDSFLFPSYRAQVTSPKLKWTEVVISKIGLMSLKTTDLSVFPQNTFLPLQSGALGKILILSRNDYPKDEKSQFSNCAPDYVEWLQKIIKNGEYTPPPFPFKQLPNINSNLK